MKQSTKQDKEQDTETFNMTSVAIKDEDKKEIKSILKQGSSTNVDQPQLTQQRVSITEEDHERQDESGLSDQHPKLETNNSQENLANGALVEENMVIKEAQPEEEKDDV